MLFTHQGATWIGGGFSETTGIPFPYDKSRMPKLSSAAKNNSWLVEMYNHYSQIGSEKYINERIKKIANWAKKNKVRVWAGETFTVGQTIEVVFGTTIDVDHYVDFRKNESDNGFQLSDESFELKNPADGKTCHTVKVTLSADHGVEPTTAGVVRVIPYGIQNKGANSGKFTVKK